MLTNSCQSISYIARPHSLFAQATGIGNDECLYIFLWTWLMLFLSGRAPQLTAVGFILLPLCLPVRPVRLVIHPAAPGDLRPHASNMVKNIECMQILAAAVFFQASAAFASQADLSVKSFPMLDLARSGC